MMMMMYMWLCGFLQLQRLQCKYCLLLVCPKVSSGTAVSGIGTEVKYPIESMGGKLFLGRFGIFYYFFQIQARQIQIYVVLQEQLNTVAVQIS